MSLPREAGLHSLTEFAIGRAKEIKAIVKRCVQIQYAWKEREERARQVAREGGREGGRQGVRKRERKRKTDERTHTQTLNLIHTRAHTI